MHPALAERIFAKDTAGINEELCRERQWTVFALAYPIMDIAFRAPDGATLRLRLHCEEWNDLPPAIELLTLSGEPVAQGPVGNTVFNNSAHAMTGRPFICMRGSREYHLHESHRTDSWDDLKGQSNYALGEIVTQVWRAWRRIHP